MIALLLPLTMALPDTLAAVEDAPVHQLGSDRWHFTQRIDAVVAAPSGRQVAISAGRSVIIVDPLSGKRLFRHVATCAPLDALAWTPQGLVGGCNNTFLTGPRVFLWQEGQKEPTFVALTPGAVTAVTLLEVEGESAVVAGQVTGAVSFIRVRDGKLLATLPLGAGAVEALVPGSQSLEIKAQSADFRLGAGGELQRLPNRLADPETSRLAQQGIHLLPGEDRAITPDGDLLVTTGKHRHVLRVHDLASGLPLTRGHGAAITESAVSPDGERAATIDLEGEVLVWRIADGTLLHRWRVSPPQRVFLNVEAAFVGWTGPDTLLVGSGAGGVFHIHLAETPKPVAERELVVHVHIAAHGQRGLFIDRNGRLSARSLGKNGKNLWKIEKILGKNAEVGRADISADGARVLTVTRQVQVHDGKTGKVLWRGPGIDAALSANGQVVAVAAAGFVTVRPVKGGQHATVPQRLKPTALALDATGQWLAIAHERGVDLYRVGEESPAVTYTDLPAKSPTWLRFADGYLLAHSPGAPSVRALPLPVEGVLAKTP